MAGIMWPGIFEANEGHFVIRRTYLRGAITAENSKSGLGLSPSLNTCRSCTIKSFLDWTNGKWPANDYVSVWAEPEKIVGRSESSGVPATSSVLN